MRNRYFFHAHLMATCSLTVMLAIVSPLVHGHGPDIDEVALGSLADAEIAFARMAAERGVREAFLANFDDEGIAFEPAPVRLRTTWSARPASSDPLAQTLDWKPLQVGVSQSRNFGYSTGPYTFSERSRPGVVRHGVFFSVWRKDSTGRWKVLLDAGVSTPGVTNFTDMGEPPRPHFHGHANIAAERRKLVAIENATAQGLAPNTYGKLLADHVRLHRNGSAPIASRGAVTTEVARRAARIVWQPVDAFIATSADMAVTYGHYREADRSGAAKEGYYAHLWVRAVDGQWRLAYDIALPSS